ncbi:MAG: TM2 domain-containing protein [Ruminococcus sp.]|nr:TM2 domain-containing protein [Ruminococcus sp.]
MRCPYCGAEVRDYCDSELTSFISGNDDSSINNADIIIGTQNNYYYAPGDEKISDKSKTAALLFCLFFGLLGVHRFYAGKIVTGIIYACSYGLFGIGIVVDLILILTNNFKDKNGRIIR